MEDLVVEAASWKVRSPDVIIAETLEVVDSFAAAESPHDGAHPGLQDNITRFTRNLLDSRPAGNDDTALITGANRGLGLATARLLGREALRVVIGSRDSSAGETAAAELRSEGIDASSTQLDITSEESLSSAAKVVTERFGRLDILVNNAGILPEATRPNPDLLDLETFRSTFETNVLGTVAATRAFLPLLRESSAGRIVNVTSTIGSLTNQSNPDHAYYEMTFPAYQMSKAALNGLTIVLSKALADTQITVNSVCPGQVQTDLGGPEHRAAAPTTAEDAARVVAELVLSAEGSTGQFVEAAGPLAW